MQQSRRHQPKSYSLKKAGIKDENIDRQIRILHQAMAKKCLAEPHLIEHIKRQLNAQREQGRLNYSAYIQWYSVLDLADTPAEFVKAMTDNSSTMRRLRRTTPFVGILTEEERLQALTADACGNISVESLF